MLCIRESDVEMGKKSIKERLGRDVLASLRFLFYNRYWRIFDPRTLV